MKSYRGLSSLKSDVNWSPVNRLGAGKLLKFCTPKEESGGYTADLDSGEQRPAERQSSVMRAAHLHLVVWIFGCMLFLGSAPVSLARCEMWAFCPCRHYSLPHPSLYVPYLQVLISFKGKIITYFNQEFKMYFLTVWEFLTVLGLLLVLSSVLIRKLLRVWAVCPNPVFPVNSAMFCVQFYGRWSFFVIRISS